MRLRYALASAFLALRYLPLLESVSDPVILTDDEGESIVGNTALEHHLGYGPDDWPQLRLRDIVIDEDVLRELCAGRDWKQHWAGSVLVRDCTGREQPLPGRAMLLGQGKDAVIALFLRPDQALAVAGAPAQGEQAAAQELQAARASANVVSQALRESEARFRGAFDASSIGMALIGLEDTFLQVNPALCAMLGYDNSELLQQTLRAVTLPDDQDLDLEDRKRLVTGEISTYQIEQLFNRKQGEIICIRLTMSLVRGSAGEPRYFVAQMQDITPFKAAGAALREAEARYRTLVEQTPAAVYVDDANSLGECLYVSPRIEALVGRSPEEWLGHGAWPRTVHPDDREWVLQRARESNATGEPFFAEYRFATPDGRVVWVHDEATLVLNEDGSRQCWQGLMVDVTDRKLAEEELRRAKEAAEEASRLKTAFLSMATHELRTPLTIISGYVELLLQSGMKHFNDEEREYVEVVQAGTRTLTMLIDDLLDLARIEAGRMHLTLRPVDVADVLERLRRMVAAQAAEKGLDIVFAVEAGLPPAAADVNRLVQILLNVVGNAIKFTEQGGIACTAHGRNGGVEIRVKDSGIGISPEALDRIFDEFHQGESGTTRRYGGTGLGLAIARRLVDMHGGHIRVESELGAGST
ncbi:MAG: PAS domain S-box protein, partial [Thermomicrobiales bacterium]|nr:PAS domain S-box protein [Thermomicrobiales bacterium]